ncbi:hypothetical protein LT709_10335 [Pseudomonas syringae pv. syringae]|uniref:hypothetical protein n=1 Tax=Pseudomonas syringae TaxID=317 RepID=UPI00200B73F1|nr:hypothetical protein [Pseudomonas syringae]MCK9701884.1 hypothetical protein [Pseudomonas syringae pv. syringae]MCK9757380.1 hypothetical protein [Pseudomonas syringae pv. syringae]MCK9773605.1 hypothetical protein [Pseudomonas syringae pv. syringae]
MTQPIQFPKDHPEFKDAPLSLRLISTVEDLIELKYQTIILKTALSPLITLYHSPAAKSPKTPIPPELQEAMKEILAATTPISETQLDIDRKAIWNMKHRSGSLYVLSFLEPKLVTSLETLFSGIVVGYMQMFNDTEIRVRLNADKVFKGQEDLKKFFNDMIKPLRNDQYAHKTSSDGQHHLSFHIDHLGNVVINQSPAHHSYEFHIESCHELYICLAHTEKYLTEEITKKSDALIERLSSEQISALRNEWRNPQYSGTPTLPPHPLTPRPPKPEIPKQPRNKKSS